LQLDFPTYFLHVTSLYYFFVFFIFYIFIYYFLKKKKKFILGNNPELGYDNYIQSGFLATDSCYIVGIYLIW
jgi:hypothetical protein